MSSKSFTARQGQYLAFIDAYTRIHGRPPAETDMQRHFQLSPPSVHQMVLTLERLGHIRRQPGVARSIEVLLPPKTCPFCVTPNRSNPLCRGTRSVLPSGEVNQQPRPCLVSIIAGERPGPRRALFVAAGATKPSAYAARALRGSTRPKVGFWLEMMNTPCAT
jgi:SOS-response transcriptional repressor LexA